MKAAEQGNSQIVQILLVAGSNPKLQNNQGRTAFMLAGNS